MKFDNANQIGEFVEDGMASIGVTTAQFKILNVTNNQFNLVASGAFIDADKGPISVHWYAEY